MKPWKSLLCLVWVGVAMGVGRYLNRLRKDREQNSARIEEEPER
jgi:hypothetical protein